MLKETPDSKTTTLEIERQEDISESGSALNGANAFTRNYKNVLGSIITIL
jgi:hypothetical protein